MMMKTLLFVPFFLLGGLQYGSATNTVYDNLALFSMNLVNVSMAEDQNVGTWLANSSLAATASQSVNDVINYSILYGADSSKFYVDLTTGDVTLAQKLDYEAGVHEFQFTVCGNVSNSSNPITEYAYQQTSMTWANAESECVKWGGHLATVETSNENAMIVNAINTRSWVQAWIGLNDIASEGTFQWISSSSYSYNNFISPEPNDNGAGEDCVSIASATWSDRPCVYSTKSVCEKMKSVMVGCTVYQVSLLNVIDTAPSFSKTSDTVTVTEKILRSTSIYQLSITKEAPVSFYYNTIKTPSATRAMFTLSSNGSITLSSNAFLDHDTTTSYVLYIYAQIASPTLTSNEFTLIINVTDVNDNSPVFNSNSYRFNVTENSNVNTAVGTVVATDADGTTTNNNIKYYIQNNMYSNNLTIGQTSGVISVVGGLNYEVKRTYVFTVCATDDATDANEQVPANEKRSTCVPLIIDILNINEFLPAFNTSTYNIKISEKSPNGFEIFRFSAWDGDNTTVYFQYVNFQTTASDIATFKLNYTTGVLTLYTDHLDFEAQSTYNLYVEAVDSASLLVGGKARLIIDLVDINDNGPVFSSDLYDVSILENGTIGGVVTTMSASDKDGISSGKIIYYILPNHYSDKFAINPITGEVYVAKKLDYEQKIYKFVITVCANDSTIDSRQQNPGDEARIGCTIVQILLVNIIDTVPIFPTYSKTIQISEKSLSGRFIYQLTSTGEAKHLFYYDTTKTTSNAQNKFTLDSTSGVITLTSNTRLDYDNGDTVFELFFYSKTDPSLGSPSLLSKVLNLTIIVIDVNDNSPVFTANTYTFNIFENSNYGTAVGTVVAADADGYVANKNVTYFIASNPFYREFAITGYSGVISVIGVLDYETKTDYRITVCAEDRGVDANQQVPTDEKRITCVPVTINILKINEHMPVFQSSVYAIDISEKSPNGLEVFQYTATDADNTAVYYRFDTSQSTVGDMSKFLLDNTTGVLTLNANELDFEVQYKFYLYVQSFDSVSNVGGGIAKLTIRLADVNDNSPVFTRNITDVLIAENSGIGTLVVSMPASDSDGISSGRMYYYILPNYYSSKFSINSTTGDVRVATNLDYEDTIKTFLITVCASDSTKDPRQNDPGAESRTSCTMIQVSVSNIIDNIPQFPVTNLSLDISEKTPVGAFIYKLSANNRGETLEYIYNTVKTSAANMIKFTISPESGDIKLSNTILDYENGQFTYELYFYCRNDVKHSLLGNEFHLTVNLIDVNDNPPIFLQPLYTFEVNEGSPFGTYIGNVTAVDSDITSSFKTVSYYIRNPQYHNAFSVDKFSGRIHANGLLLDRESNISSIFTVCASDNVNDIHQQIPKSESRETCCEVSVNILDENDNKPFFSSSTFNIQLSERVPINTNVFTFTARDIDLGVNSRVVYKIVHGFPAGDFSLNQDTGILTSVGPLDYERAIHYNICVQAENVHSSVKQTSAMTYLYINVKDVNDNSPRFTQDIYKFTIPLSSEIGRVVGTVNATDGDGTRIYSDINYMFKVTPRGYKYFLDKNTGVITVGTRINVTSVDTLSAMVNDMRTTTTPNDLRQGFTIVEITVIDYTPIFPHICADYIIALVIIAALAFIALCFLIALLFYKRKRRTTHTTVKKSTRVIEMRETGHFTSTVRGERRVRRHSEPPMPMEEGEVVVVNVNRDDDSEHENYIM